MLTLRKVAITGSIASGKSTVCDLFRNLGAEVVSADIIVHELLSNDPQTIEAVTALLGQDVLNDKSLDRSKIANAVFNNPILLKSLENLLHPIVKHAIEERYIQASKKNYPLFVAEIPLLFETGADQDYDITLCVVSKEHLRRKRYNNNHPNKNDFDKRQNRQWDEEQKVKHADIIIENNGTLEELKTMIDILFKKLTK